MLAEKKLQGAPLLVEYSVPLECGPVLVSTPKGPLWVRPSKRSMVRASPGDYLTNRHLVQELLKVEDLTLGMSELRDQEGNLDSLGWKDPLLEVSPGDEVDVGVPLKVVDYLPPGVRLLAEREQGFRGLRSSLDTGECLFKVHPYCSMRFIRGA